MPTRLNRACTWPKAYLNLSPLYPCYFLLYLSVEVLIMCIFSVKVLSVSVTPTALSLKACLYFFLPQIYWGFVILYGIIWLITWWEDLWFNRTLSPLWEDFLIFTGHLFSIFLWRLPFLSNQNVDELQMLKAE